MVEALQHSAHAIGEKFGTKVADNFYHVPIDKKALLSLASALFLTVVLFRWSVSKDLGTSYRELLSCSYQSKKHC